MPILPTGINNLKIFRKKLGAFYLRYPIIYFLTLNLACKEARNKILERHEKLQFGWPNTRNGYTRVNTVIFLTIPET